MLAGQRSPFNPYSVGRKVYGGGRDFPTMGRVDPLGYRQRDMEEQARRNAMLKKLQAGFLKDYGSANYLQDLGS